MKAQDIREIEISLGLTIPSEYALLLLDHPGISQDFELFASPNDIIETNLEARRNGFWGATWEETHLIIGVDGCGNSYFITTNPFDRKVYLADHEEAFDPSDISKLTSYPSLDEFVNELAEIQSEIENGSTNKPQQKSTTLLDLLVSIYRTYRVQVWLFIIALILAYVFLPRSADLGNPEHDIGGQKIVIIPSGEIPMPFLNHLEKNLEAMHGTDVLISTSMGLDKNWILEGTGQYHAGYLSKFGDQVFKTLRRDGAYCIVLTNEDINHPNSGLRFLFSIQYPSNSVVSLARMNPWNMGLTLNILNVPYAFNQTSERALKIINKELGKGLYGYPISNDRESVMYGPIMSVKDLDSVGIWYK